MFSREIKNAFIVVDCVEKFHLLLNGFQDNFSVIYCYTAAVSSI